jgi:hypothetical protein
MIRKNRAVARDKRETRLLAKGKPVSTPQL